MRTKDRQIPKEFKPFLWSYDTSKMDLEKNKKRVCPKIELSNLLELAERKFPEIDTNLILKSLVYFEDMNVEPIIFKHNKDVEPEEVKEFLTTKVKETQNI
jgi:hypothetical protein